LRSGGKDIPIFTPSVINDLTLCAHLWRE